MTTLKTNSILAAFLLLCMAVQLSVVNSASDSSGAEPIDQPGAASGSDAKKEDAAEKDEAVSEHYAKNSLCGYCKYCKFCSLCDTDCPCDDPKRVGCDMCGYCRYCKACKVCSTFCQAGGFLDTFTGKMLSLFSGLDLEEVDRKVAANPKIKEYL